MTDDDLHSIAKESNEGVRVERIAHNIQRIREDQHAMRAAMSDDSFLKSDSGYVKLRSGIIIQWGTNKASDPGTLVTFPIAFPSACRSVTATYAQTSDNVSIGCHTYYHNI